MSSNKKKLSVKSPSPRPPNSSDDVMKPDQGVGTPPSNVPNETDDCFTVDEAIEHFGFGWFQILISLFAGVSWMAEAMEMMILSILSPALSCEWGIGNAEQAIITSCVFCGMMFSSIIWGKVCDRYGRRIGIMLISMTTFFFGMCSAFAPNYPVFIILRTLMGVGIGGVPQSVTYYSEFLPMKQRAKCVMLMQAFWALGGAVESCVAIFVMEPFGWRCLLIISTMPLLISAATCLCVPESARFLMTCGRNEDAYKTIKMISRMNKREMPRGKLIVSRDTTKNMEKKRGNFFDLFRPEFLRTTILLLTIWFIITASYYGIILYTTVLYTSGVTCHGAKPNSTSSLLACMPLTQDDYFDFVLTSVSEFPGLLLSAILLELIGRRKTVAVDLLCFSVFVAVLALCLERFYVTTALFITRAFASGAFQSIYVYTPEVYPTTMRAVGLGAASGMGRLGALLTPFVAQVMSSIWLLFPVVLYSGFGILAACCAIALKIETRGRQMQDHMEEAISASRPKEEQGQQEKNSQLNLAAMNCGD